MSKHALVVIAPGCEELEAVASIDVLVRGGVKVTVASVCPQGRLQVTASRGVKLVADVLLDAVAQEQFDLILLPGGLPGAEYLRDTPKLIDMLKAQRARGAWRAAICATPALVLAYHHLIGPAHVTGYPGTEDKLSNYVPQPVVVDDAERLITSQGPGTAVAFALAALQVLEGPTLAQKVATGMLV
ncbi:MAG: DJ-1 family glyoxalase III [Aeromonadaceae bacterium]